MTTPDRPFIYLASPLAEAPGDRVWLRNRDPRRFSRYPVRAHLDFAESRCREIVLAGADVVAPHVYCASFLRDGKPRERGAGLRIGLRMLRGCTELWVALPPWRSEDSIGMRGEIAEAERLGIPVVDVRTTERWVVAMHDLRERLHIGGYRD